MDIKELYKLYQQHPVITTDSRDCPKGSIFVALKGETFNGNQFALSALEKGCAYAIVDEDSGELRVKSEESPERLSEKQGQLNGALIKVDDCLQTLKDLAREHRRQFDIPVIGITGTNGKTTTKELIAAVLSEKYNVLYTQGNFNNDVGVPKTLLRLKPEHEIAVIEMGASHPGDIKTLVETVEPTCGLITNVGRAHLQGFGSFEGVKRTKGELYDFLKDSLIFINADNEHLMQMAEERNLPRLFTYSQQGQGNVNGEIISCAPFLKFRWNEHEIQTHLIGSYNLDNMLAAITVGLQFDVSEQAICHALENYIPSNNRSQLTVTEHNKLIVDAYNANPTSMAAALDNFERMEVSPKMAILGMMGELGDVSREEHEKVVARLEKAHFDNVWLVGEGFKDIPCDFRKFNNVEEVKEALKAQRPENYYILIKGSNSTKLFQLPEVL
ncbi:MAG: UDP-N-acetylmuramoyl-tripeptide--D-alanyl-D-alanine ligase [Prevotella sp.]|nr:UDP-N-acetylmuramoyl-tripeptide--D-alanyl-D-alanine ligase [Prevotella sp.]